MDDARADNPDETPDIDGDAEPAELNEPDKRRDTALRPRTLEEFVGQGDTTKRLSLFIKAARGRGEPLDHVLFSGPPGLGKTTLAYLIESEMGAGQFINVSGAALVRPADLVGTLSKLDKGAVLFVDEIHRMPRACEEYLYTAMEDWRIDVQAGDEGTVSINLEHFTLVGATTRAGMLTAPLRARFKIHERLSPYDLEPLTKIVTASAARLGLAIEHEASHAVARRSRGTPRIANRMLFRIRDFAQVNGADVVDADFAAAAMDALGIDHNGLDEIDHRYLRALAKANRAIGLKSLSMQVGEETDTLEEAHEPYLIERALIVRGPRGREITDAGRVALEGGTP